MALRKRLLTLLVPMLLAQYTYYFIVVLVNSLGVRFCGILAGNYPRLSIKTILLELPGISTFPSPPMCHPTWFIRCLLIIIVFSPAIVAFVKRGGSVKMLLSFLFGTYLLASYFLGGKKLFTFGISIDGVFFFTLGILMRIKVRVIRLIPRLAGGALIVSGMVLRFCAAMYGAHYPVLAFAFNRLFVPMLIAGAWALIPGTSWPGWLTSASFPIYLYHLVVIYLAQALWKAIKCIDWTLTPLGITCMFPLYFIAVLMAVTLMRQYCPRYSKIAFGGR